MCDAVFCRRWCRSERSSGVPIKVTCRTLRRAPRKRWTSSKRSRRSHGRRWRSRRTRSYTTSFPTRSVFPTTLRHSHRPHTATVELRRVWSCVGLSSECLSACVYVCLPACLDVCVYTYLPLFWFHGLFLTTTFSFMHYCTKFTSKTVHFGAILQCMFLQSGSDDSRWPIKPRLRVQSNCNVTLPAYDRRLIRTGGSFFW